MPQLPPVRTSRGAAGNSPTAASAAPLEPAPPQRQRPQSSGGGGRRWNTPKDLQRLLFSISGSPPRWGSSGGATADRHAGAGSSIPPLVPAGCPTPSQPTPPDRDQASPPPQLPGLHAVDGGKRTPVDSPPTPGPPGATPFCKPAEAISPQSGPMQPTPGSASLQTPLSSGLAPSPPPAASAAKAPGAAQGERAGGDKARAEVEPSLLAASNQQLSCTRTASETTHPQRSPKVTSLDGPRAARPEPLTQAVAAPASESAAGLPGPHSTMHAGLESSASVGTGLGMPRRISSPSQLSVSCRVRLPGDRQQRDATLFMKGNTLTITIHTDQLQSGLLSSDRERDEASSRGIPTPGQSPGSWRSRREGEKVQIKLANIVDYEEQEDGGLAFYVAPEEPGRQPTDCLSPSGSGQAGTTPMRIPRVASTPVGVGGLFSPRSVASPEPPEVYTIYSSEQGLLDEILVCIMRQHIKVLTNLRKTLVPTGSRVLDVVHFNDVYHNEPFVNDAPLGGASRFYHLLSKIRESRNPLVLFSGDFVGPSLMSVITRGKQMIDALNFIGTHYGCFGNHEFDFGIRNLERIIHGYTQGEYIFAGSQTEWIMSNMDNEHGKPLGNVTRCKLIEWNGIKVGLLGLCENWLRACPRLGKDEATYRDIFETGEEMAQDLKAQGAAVVIAMTHNRVELDTQVTAKCPSIDLLLGGHDHFFSNKVKANRVLKSGQEYQWLSELRLIVHEDRSVETIAKAHPVGVELPEHPMLQGLVQRYADKMAEKMGKVIGVSQIPLDSTEELVRFGEGHLTNFVADIMKAGVDPDGWKCDCAILGGAAVSGKSIKEPGVITIGDVFNWFPHETKVQCVRVSGTVLRKLLQISCREIPEEAPSFPHPSAELRFTINCIHKPPRIEEVTVHGKPIDEDRIYAVALTDFVAAGKERFKIFKDKPGFDVVTDSEHAEQLSVWILDYFKQKKGQRKLEQEAEAEAEAEAAAAAGAQDGEGEETEGNELSDSQLRCTGDGDEQNSSFSPRAMKQRTSAEFQEALRQTAKQKTQSRQSIFTASMYDDDVGIDDIDDIPILQDMDIATMKKLMIAFGHLSEEIELFAAQEYIKNAVRDLLQCDRATIFLADHVNKTLKFVPDGSDKEIAIPITAGIAGYCATHGKVVNIPDAYKDERFNRTIDRETGYRTRNILACPVKRKAQAKTFGVIQAVNKDEELGPFTERDEKIMMLFGSQAGQHLHHAEVFETMENNQEATQTLLRLARELMADVTLDLKSMTAHIMAGASQLFRCDRASLYLVDNQNTTRPEMWTIIRNPTTGQETVIRLEIGKGIAGHVAATGEIIRLKDAHDSELFNQAQDQKTGYRTQQVLCVPIFTQEDSSNVLGVLQFINRTDGQDFTERDERLAVAFAAFAGLSISNSQEVDLLKLQRDEALLQELPIEPLGRITMRAGWATVRRAIKEGQLRRNGLGGPGGLNAVGAAAMFLGVRGKGVEVERLIDVMEGEKAVSEPGNEPDSPAGSFRPGDFRRDRTPEPDPDEVAEEVQQFRDLRKVESSKVVSAPAWIQTGIQKSEQRTSNIGSLVLFKRQGRSSMAASGLSQGWFGGAGGGGLGQRLLSPTQRHMSGSDRKQSISWSAVPVRGDSDLSPTTAQVQSPEAVPVLQSGLSTQPSPASRTGAMAPVSSPTNSELMSSPGHASISSPRGTAGPPSPRRLPATGSGGHVRDGIVPGAGVVLTGRKKGQGMAGFAGLAGACSDAERRMSRSQSGRGGLLGQVATGALVARTLNRSIRGPAAAAPPSPRGTRERRTSRQHSYELAAFDDDAAGSDSDD